MLNLVEVLDAVTAKAGRALTEDEQQLVSRVVRADQAAPVERQTTLEETVDLIFSTLSGREDVSDEALATRRFVGYGDTVREFEVP